MIYGESMVLICEIWDLPGYSEKSNIQEAYLPKTNFSGQIVSEILAQFRSDDSIQILLNLSLLAVSLTSLTKANNEKKNSLFFLTSGFKNSITVSCTD